MGIDPNQICKGAWRRIVLGSDVDPRLYSKFDDRCLDNMVNAESFPPSKQCVFERSGDKFVLDKKGQKRELPELKVISCLANLAIAEKWLVDAPKAVGLADDATPTAAKNDDVKSSAAKPADAKLADAPKAVGLPVDATPSVVALPNDVTPVDAAKDPTATAVGLSADATPTTKALNTGAADDSSPMLGWLGVVSGLFSFASTQVGMSANDQEPLHFYSTHMFAAAVGVLTPETSLLGTLRGRIQLDAIFDFTWLNPKQDHDYGRSVHVWDLGPKVSLHGVYPFSKDGSIFFGPHVAYLMGGLSTDGAVEVAKGKGYDTAGKFSFITSLLYGITVGAEQPPTDSQRAGGFCQLDVGVRQFFWGAKPDTSNFPATMQMDKVGFSGIVSLGVKFK